uniref:Uncharacterized protein n=1 Tax=Tanacetum cinerariifolium TaxID=118510 RepID=A0A6L2KR22_TANCI|nr:hypothetical protein [Tanacetum cinerariifolium]
MEIKAGLREHLARMERHDKIPIGDRGRFIPIPFNPPLPLTRASDITPDKVLTSFRRFSGTIEPKRALADFQYLGSGLRTWRVRSKGPRSEKTSASFEPEWEKVVDPS